jgi:hypothetical protein
MHPIEVPRGLKVGPPNRRGYFHRMLPIPRRLLLTFAIALISRSPAIADPPASGTVQWSGRTWTIRDDIRFEAAGASPPAESRLGRQALARGFAAI